MTNEKRYIVEKIVAKLMKSCTIHDSGLFICTLNKELDKYHQSELLKLNKSDVISSVCKCKGGAVGRTVTADFEHQICDKCGNIAN